VNQLPLEFPVLMRKIPGARWIPEQKAWVVLRTAEHFALLKSLFGEENVAISQNSFDGHTASGPAVPASVVAESKQKAAPTGQQERQGFKNVFRKAAPLGTSPSKEIDQPTSPIADKSADQVVVQYCADKPDRVFLQVPGHRKDWKTFLNDTPGKW